MNESSVFPSTVLSPTHFRRNVHYATPHLYQSQEVTCDGVKLISKSGPYRWEWVNRASRLPRGRKRSDKYELRVAVDGFDVRLGQEKVWGMALPPSFPEPEKT